MPTETSAWRVTDSVAYDVMRDLARSVISALLTRAQEHAGGADLEHARAVHRRATTVDPDDRNAVDDTFEWLLGLRRGAGSD